jgi:hypothetical protein
MKNRIPRKLKKAYKSEGIIGLYKWNFKYRMAVKSVLEFKSRPSLVELLSAGSFNPQTYKLIGVDKHGE